MTAPKLSWGYVLTNKKTPNALRAADELMTPAQWDETHRLEQLPRPVEKRRRWYDESERR